MRGPCEGHFDKLEVALILINMTTENKIVSLDKLSGIVAELKRQGKKIVTANGAFDILHVGHKRALEQSRSLGGVLIVGVNSDISVKQYKSDLRPIISENDRAELIAEFACVDFVTIFNEPDPKKFLEIVKPDVHTKSGDYKAEELAEFSFLKEIGTDIIIIPLSGSWSTTNIIDRILELYSSKNSQK